MRQKNLSWISVIWVALGCACGHEHKQFKQFPIIAIKHESVDYMLKNIDPYINGSEVGGLQYVKLDNGHHGIFFGVGHNNMYDILYDI